MVMTLMPSALAISAWVCPFAERASASSSFAAISAALCRFFFAIDLALSIRCVT
jgi:hypothetical protein